MKIVQRLGFLLLVIILMAGCSPERESRQLTEDRSEAIQLNAENEQMDPGAATSASSSTEAALKRAGQSQAATEEEVPPEQKVIYEADIAMRVARFEQVREQMETEARKLGGYIVNGTETKNDHSLRGTFVFRIPRERLSEFLSALEKWAVEMFSKEIRGTDVTEEYVDLNSRLRAKQAEEKRLLELMKQAEKPEDLLKITDHLSQVQEEIEMIKGRKRYLDNRTSYATVTVNLEQPVVLKKSGGGLWQQIKQSFSDSVTFLVNLFQKGLVALAAALPPLLILAAIGIPLWKRYRRRRHFTASPKDDK